MLNLNINLKHRQQ